MAWDKHNYHLPSQWRDDIGCEGTKTQGHPLPLPQGYDSQKNKAPSHVTSVGELSAGTTLPHSKCKFNPPESLELLRTLASRLVPYQHEPRAAYSTCRSVAPAPPKIPICVRTAGCAGNIVTLSCNWVRHAAVETKIAKKGVHLSMGTGSLQGKADF